jgi:DNA polymerase III subunit alpha
MAIGTFWSIHTHSRYSVNDAMSGVDELVDEAAALGYPALGLTDHGTVAGLVQHYRACRRHGMEPLPGVELYVAADREAKIQGHNLHLTVNAYTPQGYRNLCKLITRTAVNYYFKPIVDFADFAEMAEEGLTEGLSVATGCWFGVLPTIIRRQGTDAAVAMAKALAGWFPRVYIELQNHGIPLDQQRADVAWNIAGEQLGEAEMVAELLEVAQQASLPYLITTDAHYTWANQQVAHNSFKLLCSFSDEPDDAIFPGDPYCLRSSEELKAYFSPEVIADSNTALAELADKSYVRIPELDRFKMLVPDVTHGGDANSELRLLVLKGLSELLGEDCPKARKDRYAKWANEELETVAITGMASYLLLANRVTAFMREQNVIYNVRGSANDFLLCWALRITFVDPVKWGLRPERFLSADRTKPPDIDFDVEHERRELVAAWLAQHFYTCKVGTITKYKLEGQTDDEYEGESGRGSLKERYLATMRKQGRPLKFFSEAPLNHRRALFALADMKLIKGFGTHPAGLIVSPDAALISQLPMTRLGSAKNAHLITSFDKNDVEDMGFIKLDLLGSRFMTAARLAIELIAPGQPVSDYLEAIPLNDSAVYRKISAGRVDAVFQLQERTARNFITKMAPKNINDIVAAMGLTRPAAKNAGVTDTYLARRSGFEQMPLMHPDLVAETTKTYGLLLYQEQVIGALRTIGMDMAELNTLLKAIKSSNDYVAGARAAIEAALPRIRSLVAARDWSPWDVKLLVDAISGYADYGFNEAHAVAYGLLCYRTAWLGHHYPAQWWTGVLTAYTGTDKEKRYVGEAQRNGVTLAPPHVNYSGAGYRYEPARNVVRKGFQSIEGIGSVAAAELAAHQPYASLKDLGMRVLPVRVSGATALALGKDRAEWSGKILSLDLNGALRGLE